MPLFRISIVMIQEEESPAARRRQRKLVEEIGEFLRLISREARGEFFGERSNDETWQMLNSTRDQRTKFIDWLDRKITEAIADETKGMTERFTRQKIQDTYRTSKSTVMKKYINKQESPPCPIDQNVICKYFQETWRPPRQTFFEADENTKFFLHRKLPDDDIPKKMMEYMLSDDNIRDVIRSCDDLSARGNDGISYQIVKAAGLQGVDFMRHIIKAIIQSRRVLGSWKEARTVLIYKKGDRNDPRNWRPITMTNFLYRIYTCLMARAFQQMNVQYGIYANVQKGFIKKTKGCSEHAIMLNELFNDAKRKSKELIGTAIDFTNAFGSVPHELIMSALRQLNFPEWVREIIKDIYEDAKSTIEHMGNQTDPIKWRKGVKQGCPLSPLLFNICLEPLLQAIKRSEYIHGTYADTRWNCQVYSSSVCR
jgi:hypothetical protein